jgi:hypothetical protein
MYSTIQPQIFPLVSYPHFQLMKKMTRKQDQIPVSSIRENRDLPPVIRD